MTRSRWFLPLFALALGLGLGAAELVGGDYAGAAWAVGVAGVFAVLVLLGGRSETVRGLRGDGRDERFRQMDVRATAIAGLAVITALVAAFAVEVARGHSGAPYTWLSAIAGLAYLAAVVVFRLRG